MTRRHFVMLAGAAPLMAAESWETPAFPNWKPEFVDRLLTDSPWSRPLSVQFEYRPEESRFRSELMQIRIPGVGWPGGRGTGDPGKPASVPGGTLPSVRTEVYLTVRWSSALPIRQALALTRWGRNGLGDPKAMEWLNREENDYVVEVFGLPTSLAPEGTKRLEAGLLRSAGLGSKGRRAIAATSALVPEHGTHLSAEFRFPKADWVNAEAGTLEFTAEAGQMKIVQKFKLKDMQYRGRLEL